MPTRVGATGFQPVNNNLPLFYPPCAAVGTGRILLSPKLTVGGKKGARRPLFDLKQSKNVFKRNHDHEQKQ